MITFEVFGKIKQKKRIVKFVEDVLLYLLPYPYKREIFIAIEFATDLEENLDQLPYKTPSAVNHQIESDYSDASLSETLPLSRALQQNKSQIKNFVVIWVGNGPVSRLLLKTIH